MSTTASLVLGFCLKDCTAERNGKSCSQQKLQKRYTKLSIACNLQAGSPGEREVVFQQAFRLTCVCVEIAA